MASDPIYKTFEDLTKFINGYEAERQSRPSKRWQNDKRIPQELCAAMIKASDAKRELREAAAKARIDAARYDNKADEFSMIQQRLRIELHESVDNHE